MLDHDKAEVGRLSPAAAAVLVLVLGSVSAALSLSLSTAEPETGGNQIVNAISSDGLSTTNFSLAFLPLSSFSLLQTQRPDLDLKGCVIQVFHPSLIVEQTNRQTGEVLWGKSQRSTGCIFHPNRSRRALTKARVQSESIPRPLSSCRLESGTFDSVSAARKQRGKGSHDSEQHLSCLFSSHSERASQP